MLVLARHARVAATLVDMEKERDIAESKTEDAEDWRGRKPLTPLAARTVVFISHANPEDNAITAWFGARLAAAGYEVWTDLTRLLGGEEMWLDIDDALRFHARKFIVLLSRSTTDSRKEGVRAEIDRAVVYRKKLDDRRFVIPVKIDDVPYEDLPPGIGNRTVIDSSQDLASGLARILKILNEDEVPRLTTPSKNALLRWHTAFAPQDYLPEKADDSLITNWYPNRDLPNAIHFYDISRPLNNVVTEPALIARDHPLPMAAHWRRLVTFGDWHEVQEPIVDTTPVKLYHSMTLDDFLGGGDEVIKFEKGVPRRHLSNLIRQAWDRRAADAGLSSFMLSERSAAWYVPKSAIDGDKVFFTRVSGVEGWRLLYGVYGLRERNWHFGATGKLMVGDPLRLKLTPHVVYTDPEDEKPATASYRRAHCKLWFNAKWRDLLYAYVKLLTDENGQLVLPLASDAFAVFDATPISVSLPVRPPKSIEQSAATAVALEGDAEDIDVSELLNDPAFSELIEYDEDTFVVDHSANKGWDVDEEVGC